MVGRVKSVELRHRAKLRGSLPDSCRDIAVFIFFKMAATAISF